MNGNSYEIDDVLFQWILTTYFDGIDESLSHNSFGKDCHKIHFNFELFSRRFLRDQCPKCKKPNFENPMPIAIVICSHNFLPKFCITDVWASNLCDCEPLLNMIVHFIAFKMTNIGVAMSNDTYATNISIRPWS